MFCAEAMAADATATSRMRVLSAIEWDRNLSKNLQKIQKNEQVQIIKEQSEEKNIVEIVFQ
jgi:hypothetical protein